MLLSDAATLIARLRWYVKSSLDSEERLGVRGWTVVGEEASGPLSLGVVGGLRFRQGVGEDQGFIFAVLLSKLYQNRTGWRFSSLSIPRGWEDCRFQREPQKAVTNSICLCLDSADEREIRVEVSKAGTIFCLWPGRDGSSPCSTASTCCSQM